MTELVVPGVILDVVKDDPDDNKILECAQSAHSECIDRRQRPAALAALRRHAIHDGV